MNFEWKSFKPSRVWKMINMGKLRVYNNFPSVYHLLNSGEWMESYEQKIAREETEWSSGRHADEVQLLHRVQFRRLCITMKAERMISTFSKLHKNSRELEKTFYMKKFRIFHSFPTVYYLPHSDEVCENYSQKTILAIFKIDIKPQRIRRNILYMKVSHLFKLSNAI